MFYFLSVVSSVFVNCICIFWCRQSRNMSFLSSVDKNMRDVSWQVMVLSEKNVIIFNRLKIQIQIQICICICICVCICIFWCFHNNTMTDFAWKVMVLSEQICIPSFSWIPMHKFNQFMSILKFGKTYSSPQVKFT